MRDLDWARVELFLMEFLNHDTMTSALDKFIVTVNGQIEDGEYMGGSSLAVSFEFVWGKFWSPVVVTGESVSFHRGQTQIAGRKPGFEPRYTWNFPFSLSLKSTNPFGWPKLIVMLTIPKGKGDDEIVGYGWVHVPMQEGRHTVEIPLFRPKSTSIIQQILAKLSRSPIELIEPKFITESEGRAVTRMQSEGKIRVTFDTILKDFHK